MLRCWAWKPSDRPTFKEIHGALENMFMETDINEEVARSLNMTPEGEEEEEGEEDEEEDEEEEVARFHASSMASGKESPGRSRAAITDLEQQQQLQQQQQQPHNLAHILLKKGKKGSAPDPPKRTSSFRSPDGAGSAAVSGAAAASSSPAMAPLEESVAGLSLDRRSTPSPVAFERTNSPPAAAQPPQLAHKRFGR